MRGLRTLVSLTAGALAVTGCVSFGHERPAALRVQPVQTVRNGAIPEAVYRLGRYFQGQLRYEQAIDAYTRVLASNPNHAGAHNALGVIYSLQRRAELAERELRAALAIAPDAAGVHNNLGYHLMCNGRVEEALASFERAHTLDPENTRVAANIATARGMPGLPTDAPLPALAERRAAAQRPAPAGVPVPGTTMRLDRLAEGVWALRRASALAAQGDAYRIEIANGNGATGLARRVSNLLAPRGITGPRLTNDKPYGVVNSLIQHVAGAEQAAREINSSLPVRLPLLRVQGLERNVRVRVLLGKDFPRNMAPAPMKLAIVGTSGNE